MKRSIQKKLANQALNDGLPILASIHIGANKTEKKLRAETMAFLAKHGDKKHPQLVAEVGEQAIKNDQVNNTKLIVSIYDKIKR